MTQYPHLEYSLREVSRSAEFLCSSPAWTDRTRADIIRAFQVVNSFRDSHLYPMRRIRHSLIATMRACGASGFTSARPKRWSSIRRKLLCHPGKLHQMQDLAGVRAVVTEPASVLSLVQSCRDRFRHSLDKEYDYITSMKSDGYRSFHFVFRYTPYRADDSMFEGRRCEVQIRTELQHSWATAVEAVGLFRGENLKAGEGSSDWLRLFRLMSEELALDEREFACPVAPDPQRRAEIRELNYQLEAQAVLDRTRYAVRYVDDHIQPRDKPKYFIVRFDRSNRIVTVSSSNTVRASAMALHRAEIDIDNEDTTVAMVEVNRVEGLKAAYPNYFGDVRVFAEKLRSVCLGLNSRDYTLKPQESVAQPRSSDRVDPSWLRRRGRWFPPVRK